MTPGGKYFDWKHGPARALPEHSGKKLDLFGAYIERYIRKTALGGALRHHASYKLTLADAFAGGGEYESGQQGSPLVMLEAARKALDDIANEPGVQASRRPWKPHIQILLNDDSTEAVERLKRVIEESRFREDERFDIHITALPLVEWIDVFLARVRAQQRSGHRTVVFLDQTGYSDVLPEHIRKIMGSLKRSEVIMTYPVGWMLNRTTGGISPGHWKKNKGHEWVRQDIRDDLLRGELTPGTEAVLMRQLVEYMALTCNANEYSCLTLNPNRYRGDNQQKLWILHMTRSPGGQAARDEMVEAEWGLDGVSLYWWTVSPAGYLGWHGLRKGDENQEVFGQVLKQSERDTLSAKEGEELAKDLRNGSWTETAGGIMVRDALDLVRNRAALTRADMKDGLWSAIREDPAFKVFTQGGRVRSTGSNQKLQEADRIVETGQLWFTGFGPKDMQSSR